MKKKTAGKEARQEQSGPFPACSLRGPRNTCAPRLTPSLSSTQPFTSLNKSPSSSAPFMGGRCPDGAGQSRAEQDNQWLFFRVFQGRTCKRFHSMVVVSPQPLPCTPFAAAPCTRTATQVSWALAVGECTLTTHTVVWPAWALARSLNHHHFPPRATGAKHLPLAAALLVDTAPTVQDVQHRAGPLRCGQPGPPVRVAGQALACVHEGSGQQEFVQIMHLCVVEWGSQPRERSSRHCCSHGTCQAML